MYNTSLNQTRKEISTFLMSLHQLPEGSSSTLFAPAEYSPLYHWAEGQWPFPRNLCGLVDTSRAKDLPPTAFHWPHGPVHSSVLWSLKPLGRPGVNTKMQILICSTKMEQYYIWYFKWTRYSGVKWWAACASSVTAADVVRSLRGSRPSWRQRRGRAHTSSASAEISEPTQTAGGLLHRC